jgi:hypothetical protein
MKYLRKYNESNEEQNLDFVLAKIKDQFSIDDVKESYEKETTEWSDDYSNTGNGEAQDVILDQMIGWFESNHNRLSPDVSKEVYNKLQQEYELLNIA